MTSNPDPVLPEGFHFDLRDKIQKPLRCGGIDDNAMFSFAETWMKSGIEILIDPKAQEIDLELAENMILLGLRFLKSKRKNELNTKPKGWVRP